MKILLIDDDRRDIELALKAFSEINLDKEVRVANSGFQALETLFKNVQLRKKPDQTPQLIILDLKMPEIDGFHLLSKIKKDKSLKLIPVIIFSSSGEMRDIVKSYKLGANAYVIKPIRFEKFFETIKEIIRFWISINVVPTSIW